MQISVNLATKPFVELRPLFLRLRLTMGLLAVLAIGLGFGLHFLNIKAQAAQSRMDDLRGKTLAFQQERQKNESRMRQPQNMAVLARSQFLNDLFAKKSFSWTSVMMDLERVLPTGLQVTSIEPAIAKDGTVSIRLKVTGDRDRAVQLVRNLELSHRFVGSELKGERLKASTATNARGMIDPNAASGVEFDIVSGYNPLPMPAVAAAGETEAVPASKTGKTTAKVVKP
ncbi:type IV pilus assembly protein PilN [Granulicella pectinivorans]|jgi:type IV pilus assembly protein PilN|uniref:Type IV pilus assembly protein PilN n=1 Tax=Granulicella pectinivorans TaxID=474950 RepID=A0A1I6MZW2_9BACT|nr:fimbrial assembly protein [Granulicella pectinivorans]SFS21236.1 type IV pilus assembly protein PilN [Granulicella pectinivorans]